MKKVVTIGGGNGQSVTLRALKKFLPQVEITAIVSVSDSGGSSGRLREKFNILPVGDILRVILALSAYPYLELRQIFYSNRFAEGELKDHNIGNLLLTFLHQESGSWLLAIKGFSEVLKIQGRVLPVTLDLTELCAELENGAVVRGETNIDKSALDCYLRKKRLWLEPGGKILSETRETITEADYIILGSGDVYTSIIPNLLVEGMREALAVAKAKMIFIPNLANRERGETCGFNISDYLSEINKYLPRRPDYAIVQDPAFQPNLTHFNAKKWEPVEIDEGNWRKEYQTVFADLYAENEAGMDWNKLAIPLGKILEFK
ncbi:MAG: YvcK family protein [Candidatus Magasanikbacteria bacterium]|nr:YvcK family protein [Candidatus Magasanikbacteria bacterium]